MRCSAFPQIVGKTPGLAFRFRELAEQRAMELGVGLRAARFGDRGDGGIRLLQPALLNHKVLLVLCELLERFQVGEPRAQFLVGEVFTDVDALLELAG